MGSFAFSRKVAARYLWSRRAEAFISIITIISVLGIAIGVMVMTTVMAVMTGFEYELRDKITSTNSHIVVRRIGGKISQWQKVSATIEKVAGVKSVSPFTYHQALLNSEGNSTGVLVRGVSKGSAAAEQLARTLEPGESIDSLFSPPAIEVADESGEPREVNLPALVVGHELARTYALLNGTPVSILSPQTGSTPFGLMPKFRRFVVSAAYKSGLVDYENTLVYASIEEAQKFFSMGDAVSGLEVRVFDVDASPQITTKIMEALGGISSGFMAEDWTQVNKPLWDAIKMEKRVYFIVLLLIVLMASFSIITTLVMIVLEKRKDIAVLKTMGASTASVGRIFFAQGAIIGLLGTCLGTLLGFGLCIFLKEYGWPLDERVFQMSTLPVRIIPLNFGLVALVTFLICCVATIYPARRASAVNPAEVLRYE